MIWSTAVQKGVCVTTLALHCAFSASAQSPGNTTPGDRSREKQDTEKSKPQQIEIALSIPLMRENGVYRDGDGWRAFFGERLEYQATHRLTLRSMVDVARESEEERDVPSELLAKRVRKVIQKAVVQTALEELSERTWVDDWAQHRLIEPAQEFTEDYLIEPAAYVITSPFRLFMRKPLYERGMSTRLDLLQDALSGRQERNQLINPLNNEGIPGEERYRPSILPEKLALGVRPFQSNPYGYGTLRLGEWYAHARLSTADVLEKPRLNEASLLLQTEAWPYGAWSFGYIKPFKNNHDKDEAERYFGGHGYLGWSLFSSNGNGKHWETYAEGRFGRNQGFFVGANWRF